MINRLLIRIKTLQILYNYYRVEGMSMNSAIGTLRKALDHSYKLYIYLCGIPLDIANIAEDRLEREKEKFLKDTEVINILEHLSDNKLVNIIKSDETSCEERQQIASLLQTRGLEDYLQTLTTSAVSYIQDVEKPINWDDFSEIRSIWRGFYGEKILQNEVFSELIEETSTYLNDDIGIVFTFVTKAFNAISEEKTFSEVLKPPFVNEADEDFGPILIEQSIINGDDYRELISNYFKNWDKERVSEMDYIIMQLALTEAIHFPTIATRITINEYLNLAHYYSAPNSYTFINGILHELFTDLKKEGRIMGE